jgi:hypothetical protein
MCISEPISSSHDKIITRKKHLLQTDLVPALFMSEIYLQ